MPDILVEFAEFESLAVSFLQSGQSLRFRARGESMHPFINNGDLVEVKPVPINSFRRGDIVFCRLTDSRLVIHRVIQVMPGSLITQGDSLLKSDGIIPAENVLGRVVTIIQKGKLVRLDSSWMKLLSFLWSAMAPLRLVLQKIIERIKRLIRKQNLLDHGYSNKE